MANSQEVYLGDSNNDRQSEMVAETVYACMYTSGFDRHLDFHNEWVVGRHSWCDPSTLMPCLRTIMQHFTATRYVLYDDLLLLPVLSVILKMKMTPRSHFHSPTVYVCASLAYNVGSRKTWYIDMATKTRNNYTSGTLTDSVEISKIRYYQWKYTKLQFIQVLTAKCSD